VHSFILPFLERADLGLGITALTTRGGIFFSCATIILTFFFFFFFFFLTESTTIRLSLFNRSRGEV